MPPDSGQPIPVCGRYAPSPTGTLHLGNLRTAVAAWAHARSLGGRFLMRVEDLDSARVVEGAEAIQLDDLRSLGMDWDEPLLRQSERLDVYEDAFADLRAKGLVYRCFCSRAEVKAALSAPHATDPIQRYPGTCAELSDAESEQRAAAGEQHSWRIRTAEAPLKFPDSFAPALPDGFLRREGDFVVRRGDGPFAYQLACAVDDAVTGVRHVLRGGDLLESGARQAWVMQCLGHVPPEYLHIPLVVCEDGRRLSKRDGDDDLRGPSSQGIDATAVLSWIAWSLGVGERGVRTTPEAICRGFDLGRVPRDPWVFRLEDVHVFA